MLTNIKRTSLLMFIIVHTVISEFVAIQWNVSADRENSNLERDYSYPMFNEIAQVPCDLREDYCDVFCCHDSDCDFAQKESFHCLKPNPKCAGALSIFDCSCDNNSFDVPEWFSFFCFVYKNPIYLGMFFTTPPKIDSGRSFRSLTDNKFGNRFKYYKNIEQKFSSSVKHYMYGSPVMTYIPVKDNLNFPSLSPFLGRLSVRDASHACISQPVKFGVNLKTSCLRRITRELCESQTVLSYLPYLIKEGAVASFENSRLVLKNLDFLKGVDVQLETKFVSSQFQFKKFGLEKQIYFTQNNDFKTCDNCINVQGTIWSGNTCQYVLSSVQYKFIINGSDIVKLEAEYVLTNISVPNEAFDNYKNNNREIDKYIYFKQLFSVTFFDILSNESEEQIIDKEDGSLDRGYFLGETPNFGYRRVNNSSVLWERGVLGVFKNGGSCDNLVPVTFGYDSLSVCYIRENIQNCTQLRKRVEKNFDLLLKGDDVASYSNFRAPYDDFVPVLRTYASGENANTSSTSRTCHVPIYQNVIVEYTSLFDGAKARIHRIIGMRVDRKYRSVPPGTNVKLTSEIIFLDVPSFERHHKTRFWEKMFSHEMSENAWLNILNAFHDVNPDELEEVTFWSIALIPVMLSAVLWIKLNPNLGKFLISRNYALLLSINN